MGYSRPPQPLVPAVQEVPLEAHSAHPDHAHHHEMPTEGRALTGLAVSATLHCLTGCAIGEVAGVAIGTALGFSDPGTIALAVAIAFLFALPVNRWLLARGRGHAAVHETGIHGGPDTRIVGAVTALAFLF